MSRKLRFWIPCLVLLMVLPSLATAQLQNDDLLWVWLGTTDLPETAFQKVGMGSVGYIDSSGAYTEVLDISNSDNRVAACGQNALAPDGDTFALYIGSDTSLSGGTLYLLRRGNEEPLTVANDIQYLACLGANGRFQFSPSGNRFAYIDYEQDASQSEFADGRLFVHNSRDAQQIVTSSDDNVVSFDFLDGDNLVYLSFFTDPFQNVNEVALTFWSPEEVREVIGWFTPDGCRYISGYVYASMDYYWVVLGQRCAGQSTEWQLMRVAEDGSNALLAITEDPGGRLDNISETNNIFVSSDQGFIYYTVPDGLSSYTVGLKRVPFNDLAQSEAVINQYAIMPKYGTILHTEPALSPDGRMLALAVTNRAQTEGDIHLIDLATGQSNELNIQGVNSTIRYMGFSPDSQTLIYVAGNNTDSSVYRVDVASLNTVRLVRGRFTEWAILSADGGQLAILERENAPAGSADPFYVDLQLIGTQDGGKFTLLSGLLDGGSRQFAVPLFWSE